jgi:antitoxin component YwqK of YwqJK toxin-antitoxin module
MDKILTKSQIKVIYHHYRNSKMMTLTIVYQLNQNIKSKTKFMNFKKELEAFSR